MALLLTACSLAQPPRLATATARAAVTATPSPEPLILPAATPTIVSGSSAAPPQTVPNPAITVWVNETSARHEAMLEALADDFASRAQVDVEMILVSPMLLPDLVNAAVLSDTLPDIIIHPLEFSVGWAERDILDSGAAAEVIDLLDRNTFNLEALSLVQTADDQLAALPMSGYPQIIIYRSDWFSRLGLAAPDSFQTLFAAAQATHDPENLISGFVVPTEANLVTTQQIFEHMALANGCQLIDDQGELKLLEPACAEALTFYFRIINQFSPIGVQTDTSARNAYLAGRTGLIMGSPSLLAQLAGLDPAALPSCPECAADPGFLAQNSEVLTQIDGVAYGNMSLLGITSAAEREAAVQFAAFWFSQGYPQWLGIDSERKVPLRWGTPENTREYIDSWGSQPLNSDDQSLLSLYGPEVVDRLREAMVGSERWGLSQAQGRLITTLYEELTLSIVLQEMLSGYFSSDQSIIEAYNRVIELIPNYAFPNLTDE